jgi:hypothetical protein
MDGQAIISVSAAVVAFTQLVKYSPIPTTGFIPVILVFLFAGLGCALWAVSNEPAFDRHLLFNYFAGWIAVATSAGGVFSLSQAAHSSVTGNRSTVVMENTRIEPDRDPAVIVTTTPG